MPFKWWAYFYTPYSIYVYVWWYYIDGTKINTLTLHITRVSNPYFILYGLCYGIKWMYMYTYQYTHIHPKYTKILRQIQTDPWALWHTCVHWNFVDWLAYVDSVSAVDVFNVVISSKINIYFKGRQTYAQSSATAV